MTAAENVTSTGKRPGPACRVAATLAGQDPIVSEVLAMIADGLDPDFATKAAVIDVLVQFNPDLTVHSIANHQRRLNPDNAYHCACPPSITHAKDAAHA